MARVRRGYTLIEVLIVVTVMGIMGAMVIPNLSQAGTFRVRSAVRTLVSDITFAQSDAMAFQRGRAIVFYPEQNRYVVVEVTGPELDPENDALFDQTRESGIMDMDFDQERFGGAVMESASFDGQAVLIFDEMGAPVTEPEGDTPSSGGIVNFTSGNGDYWVAVDGFTGHVTTGRVEP
ncbi:MAG: prepilin-type N-terminal cleavage/methylation domain-containing protein [Phycisphaeraceae bacterium]|nr:prepilin-type N-terminal cleavage/methylation domain-containing protein [Phycisphaeraceae bacterium]